LIEFKTKNMWLLYLCVCQCESFKCIVLPKVLNTNKYNMNKIKLS